MRATVFAAVIGLAALLVAIMDLADVRFPTAADPTVPPSSSTETAGVGGDVNDPGIDEVNGESLCFDQQSRATNCTGEHSIEVISEGDACTEDEVVSYLGGVPSVEILSASPATLDDGACAVALPSGWTGSARGVLATSRGASLRVCSHEAEGKAQVPCSDPHTAEYVGSRSHSSDDPADECMRAAEFYMDRNADEILRDFEVVGQWILQGQERTLSCRVLVRADVVLEDTVRSIGPRALPVQS